MKYLFALSTVLLIFVGTIFYFSFPEPDAFFPIQKNIDHEIHSVIFHTVSTDPSANGFSMAPDYLRDVFHMIQLGGKKTIFASEAANYVIEKNIPDPNLVCLTIDDGDKGLIEHVDPLLKEFGFKATAFVFTLGSEDGQRHHPWSDLRKLEATGRWEVHSHSHAHDKLIDLSDSDLKQDLGLSLELLRKHELSGFPVLAYPFGLHDDRVVSAARQAGFNAAFIAGPNPRARWDTVPFAIPRTTVSQLMDQKLIAKKLGIDIQDLVDHIEIIDVVNSHPPSFGVGHRPPKNPNEIIKREGDLSHGQLGNAYLKPGAAPQPITFFIDEPGRYEISHWAPKTASEYEVKFDLRISSPSEAYKRSIYIQHPKTNGWNLVVNKKFADGEYTLHLYNFNHETVFDSIKIERVGD